MESASGKCVKCGFGAPGVHPEVVGWSARSHPFLPLPVGEGRGEGELPGDSPSSATLNRYRAGCESAQDPAGRPGRGLGFQNRDTKSASNSYFTGHAGWHAFCLLPSVLCLNSHGPGFKKLKTPDRSEEIYCNTGSRLPRVQKNEPTPPRHA